ncbi:DUF418 domain-containing protein [Lysinibacillus sp. KU-BSD001]|uniref:DUF418 domain-containing protein n=1 Tax=Lysinibacillus sp. KU-BSD001 TaxID=3141328 RepID=UPI0036EEF1C6
MNFQPTQLNERVTTIDMIRGFSLLGILLVNIFGFYLPQPYIMLQDWFTEAIDIMWHQALDIYVQSSFYPLFSMLFGYGLAMQYMKAQRVGTNFYKFAPKRLLILFVIGMLHALLLWWGDIIAMYAFCGLFVIALMRKNSGVLLIIALILQLLMHSLYILLFSMQGILNAEMTETAVDIQKVQNAITAYATGGYIDAFMQRLQDLSMQMSFFMWFSSLFMILPFMLMGAAAAKWRLIERAKELKGLWITLAIVATAVGLFIKSAPTTFSYTYLLYYVKVYVGGPILSVGYIAIFVVLCFVPAIVKVLSPLAKIGRMSMTMYILQSVICTTIFYNYGFGLYGKIDVPTAVYIALGIFVVQVIVAELWLSKFKQGPLEAAVKKLTYRKMYSEK